MSGSVSNGLSHKEKIGKNTLRGETGKKAQLPTNPKGSISTDRGKFKMK